MLQDVSYSLHLVIKMKRYDTCANSLVIIA